MRDVGRVDAPGKFAALNIAFAASLAISPKSIVGTSVWFCSHTSACTIDPPNVTLCLPLSQVAVSSITFVDASRDELAASATRPGIGQQEAGAAAARPLNVQRKPA